MKHSKLIAAGVLILGAPALAQEKTKVPPVVSSVLACRSQANADLRLQCYDQAAANLGQATASGALVALDKDGMRRTKRSLFGFDIPNLPFFGSDKEDDQPREIVANVVSARAAGFQNWVVELDNGSTWQTTEATPKELPPRTGDEIKIGKAAAGGYMLRVGMRQIRARRIR